jgi:hypothetical protein
MLGGIEEDNGTPVSMSGVLAEFRTHHVPNVSEQRYRYATPLVSITNLVF